MIKINKKIEYALIALRYIDENAMDRLISAREICDHFDIPFDTTAKVLQVMNNEGILSSSKGIKGGYSLNRKLSDISFYQLATLIGDQQQSFCESSKGMCDLYGKCNIADPMQRLSSKVNQYLMALSLAELFYDETAEVFLKNQTTSAENI